MSKLKFLILITTILFSCATADNDSSKSASSFNLYTKETFTQGLRYWSTLGTLLSYDLEQDLVTLRYKSGETLFLQFFTEEVFCFTFNPKGRPIAAPTNTVMAKPGKVPLDLREAPDRLVIASGSLEVTIPRESFSIEVTRKGSTVLKSTAPHLAWEKGRIAFFLEQGPGDHFYGLGETTAGLDLKSGSYALWNQDLSGYHREGAALYASIPFFMQNSPESNYGVYFDNSHKSYFDFGQRNPREVYWGSVGGSMSFYVLSSSSSSEVLQNYTWLTGRSKLPPLWALGYHQSRYSYESEARLKEIAREFRQRKIPADALFLDIDFLDDYQSFSYDRERFGSAESSFKALGKDGFKLVSIVNPGVGVDSDSYLQGETNGFYARGDEGTIVQEVRPGKAVFPNFFDAEAGSWWARGYDDFLALGIDGFWYDMNEPAVFDHPLKTLPLEARFHFPDGQNYSHFSLHNLYALAMIKTSYDALLEKKPKVRPFLLSRSGFAGIQRYAAMWTGNNSADWDHLKLNLEMVLGLSLSGIPFSGADIGGFIGTPGEELFVRWMQLGAFLPYFRNHTAKDTHPQEPWAFGKEVEALSRRAIKQRYQLLPYWYYLFLEQEKTGLPPVRPLFWADSDDPRLYNVDDAFLLGTDMLVAPQLKEGQRRRSLPVPQGDWYDYYSGQHFSGGTEAELDTPLERIPVLLRGGAVIPHWETLYWTSQFRNKKALYYLAPGTGSGILYEDDGASFDYLDGEQRITQILSRLEGRKWKVSHRVLKNNYNRPEKHAYQTFKFLLKRSPVSVLYQGRPLKILYNTFGVIESDVNVAYMEDGFLFVKITDITRDFEIEVSY